MTRIQATFFLQGCVLIKDDASIDRLQRSGIGARQLNPIITSLESTNALPPASGPLLLLDEEAFYLTHHGLLDVESSKGEVASLDFLWTAFVKRNANFPVKYKVFAYYKDKSYVVRSGMNFGVDYCAYHTLPALCHSEMCITVVDATARTGSGSSHDAARTTSGTGSVAANATAAPLTLAWRHVTTLTRVVPDVNKICVICYVLPTADAPHQPAPAITSSIDATSVEEDVCMSEGIVSGSGSSAEVRADAVIYKAKPPPVSPYLATLFPTATNTTNTTNITTSSINTTPIDFTSHTCLSLLTVRPVTAIVRRMPALCETHQTIKVIQEAYHAASTAQKKREIKALNKAKFKNNNSNGGSGSGAGIKDGKNEKYKKPYTRVSASASTTSTVPTTTTNPDTNTSTNTPSTTLTPTITNTTTDPSALLTADPATLSGRQKRIVKFLHKEALRASSTATLPHDTASTTTLTSALPKSKQMKERRDHRENRAKVMSNKNQSLLNMMQGGSSGGGSDVRGNGSTNAVSGDKSAANEGVGGSTGGCDNKNTSGVEDCPAGSNSADAAGVKRRHGDVNADTDDSSTLSFFSNLFYSSSTTTETDARDTEGRRKRCRTQYTHGSDATAGVGDRDESYLRRAASYCVVS